MLANLENSALAIGLERVSFHSNPKKGQCQRMFKLPHNCTHENMLSKWFSKSFKLGFNSMWAENFQTIQAGFRKGEEPEIKVPTTTGIPQDSSSLVFFGVTSFLQKQDMHTHKGTIFSNRSDYTMAGFPWWLSGKESTCQCRRPEFDPGLRKILWRRKWLPTPVFSPGKPYGQGNLVGYSPKCCKRVRHDLVTKQQQQQWLNN